MNTKKEDLDEKEEALSSDLVNAVCSLGVPDEKGIPKRLHGHIKATDKEKSRKV